MAVEKTPNVPPFVSYCAQLIPTVFDNSLSYYEALAALAKWLQDNVVNVINNNADVTEEYIQLTRDMKEYMDNYFDNLDVQEEINNKLDDMVEQGTLQEIIAEYIQANVAWSFNTVADMKLADNFINGSYAQTFGFHSVNDGGGAFYKVRTVTNDDVVDEMTIIALADDTLVAELILSDPINVKQLGAYGDNTHDDTAVFTYALTNKSNIFVPKGQYKITSGLSMLDNQTIYGESDANLNYSGTGYLFTVSAKNRFNIKHLNINCSGGSSAINLNGTGTGCVDYTIEDIKIYNADHGINTIYCWDFIAKNIRTLSVKYPLVSGSQTNNGTYINCYFSSFQNPIELTNNEGVVFESCDITNYLGSGQCISCYQARVTFLNCYFENLGSQRKNIAVSANESVKSNLSFIGGKISKMDSTYPLTIQPARANVTISGINRGDICIVSDNYPNTINQYCCGLSLTSLDLPMGYYDNRYTAVIDFKGDYEYTFNAYGALTQAFSDGEITLSTTGNLEYGIRIPVTSNKNYLMIVDLSLPEGVTTVKIWQNANTLARNVDVINNRLILPINTVSDDLRITFPNTVTPVKISRFYLGELA